MDSGEFNTKTGKRLYWGFDGEKKEFEELTSSEKKILFTLINIESNNVKRENEYLRSVLTALVNNGTKHGL